MTSSNTNNAKLRGRWIKILFDKPRLTLRFRAQLPEFDLRNPIIARTAIGSQEQHSCSKDHAL